MLSWVNSAMISPRYMTSRRSESDMTSLRSADSSRTPAPWSRRATIALWTNSIAPTSTPRVGWLTMSSSGSLANSRAMMTFWTFPPESVPIGVAVVAPRTSNRAMSSRAKACAPRELTQPWRATGGVRCVGMRFSATERLGPEPTASRSSGM